MQRMNMQNDMVMIAPKNRSESRLTVWSLMWAGFWTGVVLCGFVLLMR